MKNQFKTMLAFVAASMLSACGGGGSVGTTATITSTVTTPTTITSLLNVSFAALDSYTTLSLPVHYDAQVQGADNTPVNNTANDKVATLGRVLFFDKQLSFNNTVSCASCHQPTAGFSDTARFSVGFNSAAGTAHSMRLGNARYYRPGSAFWDKRAASLEAQASQPMQDANEMGFSAANGGMTALIQRMNTLSHYPPLFIFAFGDATITEARMQNALAQYERSMVSTHSRWDTGYLANYNAGLADKGRSLPIAGFTAAEDRGRALFMNAPGPGGGLGCAGCHVPPTFSLAANSLSNGLDAGETTVFKSPSLKNVAHASAFMHDGRFSTLAQVIEHYNSGVQLGAALDPKLIAPGGAPRTLNLSVSDKQALVDFLGTLNDDVLVNDTRFTTPFK